MTLNLNPYLNFRDGAKEAMEFYQSVLGGELTSMTFRDQGGMGVPEEEQDKIMHSQLVSPAGLIMASDAPSHIESSELGGFSVSLSGDDEATLTRYWEGLKDGATIGEELTKAPWGDHFGMLVDKYGVSWLVNISGAPAAG